MKNLLSERTHLKLQSGDVRRARAELGYQPQTKLEDGLAKFVEWLKTTEC